MVPREDLFANEHAQQQRRPGERGVKDPLTPQRRVVAIPDETPGGRGQRANLVGRSRGTAGRDQLRQLGRHNALDVALKRADTVLEDHAAKDDGHGGSDITSEEHRRGGAGGVGGLGEGEDGDDGRLEERAQAQAGDDLEDDDAGPAGVGLEVDVQAMTEDHHDEAEVDGRAVAAGVADVEAGGGGGDAQRDGDGEEVDAGQDRGGAEHDLEVQREVVEVGDVGEAVDVGDAEGGEIGGGFEQAQRRDRVLGDLPFDQGVDDDCHDAEDDQADDGRGVPGVGDAAVAEAEQEHDRCADDGDRAEPVHGQKAFDDGRARRVHFQEEEDEGACHAGDGD